MILEYPADQEFFDLDLRGIYLGNYVYWEPTNTPKMVRGALRLRSTRPFDRTYRTDVQPRRHARNGVHDYLKYIKFGYGRCTDHACKDIRAGLITRDEAIELVGATTTVKPSDLERWLATRHDRRRVRPHRRHLPRPARLAARGRRVAAADAMIRR